MTQVRWTEQAAQNLEDIKTFISQDSPAYALAIVSRLYEAVSQLEVFPDPVASFLSEVKLKSGS